MENSEVDLIRGVMNGNKADMEIIFNMYVGVSVKLAYLITGDWLSAEDAVQEAFIRAFKHIKAFDASKKFKPWFTKIVVNEARRAKKSTSVHSELDSTLDIINDELSIEEQVLENLNRQALLEKIHQLDLKDRLPIILKYFSGLSEKEIGQVLGLPVTTVKTRLYRARQRLKDELTAMEVSIQYGQ